MSNYPNINPLHFTPLYHRAKTGKISVWQIYVEMFEGYPTITTVFGYDDGAKQTARLKIPYGKNVGKSNETTAWQQAVSEATSKWKKKQLENYRTSLDEEIKILPMLAHKYLDHKTKVQWPCYVQPKLNGVRVLAHIQDGTVTYYSRKGKEYETLSHWNDELINLFPSGTIIDGEAFHPSLGFQEIVRRVKRVKTSRFDIESNELQYWIYDLLIDLPFEDRTEYLQIQLNDKMYSLVSCPTILIDNEDQLKSQHAHFTQKGFEGTIIRNALGRYKPNYRSYDLLKYKEFMDAEYTIVGGVSASGKDEGTVIFQCCTERNQVFSVRPRGTWEQRKQYLDSIDQLIGKKLTVRYQEMSEDGIPIFPVGICARDYE